MSGKVARELRKYTAKNTIGRSAEETRFHYKQLKKFYKFLSRK